MTDPNEDQIKSAVAIAAVAFKFPGANTVIRLVVDAEPPFSGKYSEIVTDSKGKKHNFYTTGTIKHNENNAVFIFGANNAHMGSRTGRDSDMGQAKETRKHENVVPIVTTFDEESEILKEKSLERIGLINRYHKLLGIIVLKYHSNGGIVVFPMVDNVNVNVGTGLAGDTDYAENGKNFAKELLEKLEKNTVSVSVSNPEKAMEQFNKEMNELQQKVKDNKLFEGININKEGIRALHKIFEDYHKAERGSGDTFKSFNINSRKTILKYLGSTIKTTGEQQDAEEVFTAIKNLYDGKDDEDSFTGIFSAKNIRKFTYNCINTKTEVVSTIPESVDRVQIESKYIKENKDYNEFITKGIDEDVSEGKDFKGYNECGPTDKGKIRKDTLKTNDSFTPLGNYLLLFLKIFEYDNSSDTSYKIKKDDIKIKISEEITINDGRKYVLKGLCYHDGEDGGTIDRGHYISVFKNGEQWYEASDTVIKKITPDWNSNYYKSPYLVFYRLDGFEEEFDENKMKQIPVGLENNGNTCFLNSVLQILVNIPEFYKRLKDSYYLVASGPSFSSSTLPTPAPKPGKGVDDDDDEETSVAASLPINYKSFPLLDDINKLADDSVCITYVDIGVDMFAIPLEICMQVHEWINEAPRSIIQIPYLKVKNVSSYKAIKSSTTKISDEWDCTLEYVNNNEINLTIEQSSFKKTINISPHSTESEYKEKLALTYGIQAHNLKHQFYNPFEDEIIGIEISENITKMNKLLEDIKKLNDNNLDAEDSDDDIKEAVAVAAFALNYEEKEEKDREIIKQALINARTLLLNAYSNITILNTEFRTGVNNLYRLKNTSISYTKSTQIKKKKNLITKATKQEKLNKTLNMNYINILLELNRTKTEAILLKTRKEARKEEEEAELELENAKTAEQQNEANEKIRKAQLKVVEQLETATSLEKKAKELETNSRTLLAEVIITRRNIFKFLQRQ